ncbi:uncharacterized protein PHLOEM PROTEIN 2-LIKE A4-like [Typha angustifolia]|uniref:uncharacterized protein PHLOEM PROTEIN 2-LIKE A4-like n=1 Tax=Typha angustifolia TaxID=59011 RepID=UPI003C2CEAB8
MNHQAHAAQLNSSHWNGSDKIDSENLIKKEGDAICISPKALTIIWGNSDRFWKWVKLSEWKFEEGAELIQVSWIEVTGKVEINRLSHCKTFEVFFHIKFKDDAFGWHHTPVIFEVVTPDGKKHRRSVLLETFREDKTLQPIYAGVFDLPSGHHDKEIVRFGMYEVESQWWKGGIILGGVELRPKKA